MECSIQADTDVDFKALAATFQSMEKMCIDTVLRENRTFDCAGNIEWLKDGLIGYPKCRRNDLESIQAFALTTLKQLNKAIDGCCDPSELQKFNNILLSIAEAYHTNASKGLEKLKAFPHEARLWHSSSKLSKLTTCITNFESAIANALELSDIKIGKKNSCLGSIHGGLLETVTPQTPAMAMKRGAPRPPPAIPFHLFQLMLPQGTSPEASTIAAELVSCRLKPPEIRELLPKAEDENLKNILDRSLDLMRRDIHPVDNATESWYDSGWST